MIAASPLHGPVSTRNESGGGAFPALASLVRLRTTLWGGYLIAPDQVEALLSHTGFVDVRTLPGPPGAIVALIAARRTPIIAC